MSIGRSSRGGAERWKSPLRRPLSAMFAWGRAISLGKFSKGRYSRERAWRQVGPLRPLAMHLDFGIAEVELVGPHDEEVYVVRFTCGCVGVVAHGRMIRRVSGVALVCAHVAAT